jgi:tetratricopeptide (TPR) repeat protein
MVVFSSVVYRFFKYTLIVPIILFSVQKGEAQKSIFDDEEAIVLVKKVADHIYGMKDDSLQYYRDRVNEHIPGHPIVPMIDAVTVLWRNIPVLRDSVFELFDSHLIATIEAAQKLPSDHTDAIFFEMSARGLMAEYYADRGMYMKAVNEASKAYSLLKDGFELSEQYPEFLFAVGLYNYFREAYPEKHPMYRPLLWFFMDGDKNLGLKQLKRATKEAIIIQVEAYVYLAYIYLRYEEKPDLSRRFIKELYELFPTNPYVCAKYLESYHSSGIIDRVKIEVTDSLIISDRPYYQMVGNLYRAIYTESMENNDILAYSYYLQAQEISNEIPGYGSYYKSLIHLGLGRIYHKKNQEDKAHAQLQLALQFAETDEVKDEANRWLKK